MEDNELIDQTKANDDYVAKEELTEISDEEVLDEDMSDEKMTDEDMSEVPNEQAGEDIPIATEENLRCICNDVCMHIEICDLKSITGCYMYQSTVNEFFYKNRKVIKVVYGVHIKYVDCHNQYKKLEKEANTFFDNLPPDFCFHRFSVFVNNPPCIEKNHNVIKLETTVRICY